MQFQEKYPVALNELLLAPLIFRESLKCLADLPDPTAEIMRDLAQFGGYSAGAIRTAMSRLRSSGEVEAVETREGVTRYKLSEFSRAISRSVQSRIQRPQGFLLAIFAFASEDSRERQVVRDTLRYHGFQKLAQNVYINGRIDSKAIEKVFEEQGLANNVFLFECSETDDPALRRRLLTLFDVAGREKALSELLDHLDKFLKEPARSSESSNPSRISKFDDEQFARRFLYAGPVHYRITYIEEPPLPSSYLPPHYPLEKLNSFFLSLAETRAELLRRYYLQFERKR